MPKFRKDSVHYPKNYNKTEKRGIVSRKNGSIRIAERERETILELPKEEPMAVRLAIKFKYSVAHAA